MCGPVPLSAQIFLVRDDGETEIRSVSPGRFQMSIFGEKSSLGVLLRLTRQAHALGDEDAHLPFSNEHLPMTILPMGIFSSLILRLAWPLWPSLSARLGGSCCRRCIGLRLFLRYRLSG